MPFFSSVIKFRAIDAKVYVIVSREKITPIMVTSRSNVLSFRASTGSLKVRHMSEIKTHIATVALSKCLMTGQKESDFNTSGSAFLLESVKDSSCLLILWDPYNLLLLPFVLSRRDFYISGSSELGVEFPPSKSDPADKQSSGVDYCFDWFEDGKGVVFLEMFYSY